MHIKPRVHIMPHPPPTRILVREADYFERNQKFLVGVYLVDFRPRAARNFFSWGYISWISRSEKIWCRGGICAAGDFFFFLTTVREKISWGRKKNFSWGYISWISGRAQRGRKFLVGVLLVDLGPRAAGPKISPGVYLADLGPWFFFRLVGRFHTFSRPKMGQNFQIFYFNCWKNSSNVDDQNKYFRLKFYFNFFSEIFENAQGCDFWHVTVYYRWFSNIKNSTLKS